MPAGFVTFQTVVCRHCQILQPLCCLSVIKDW